MKYRHLIALGLAAFLLAACKPAADEPKAPDADVATPAQPPASDATGLEPPPAADVADKTDMLALQVTTLDGKPYALADHRDNRVVANCWATWYAPCLTEMTAETGMGAGRGRGL